MCSKRTFLHLIYLFVALLFLPDLLYPDNYNPGYQITEERSGNRIHFKISFAVPDIDTLLRNGSAYTLIHVNGMEPFWKENYPEIQALRKMINTSPANFTYRYVIREDKLIPLPYPLFISEEKSTNGQELTQNSEIRTYPFPEKVVMQGGSGTYRRIPFTTLLIFPLQCIDSRKVRWISEIDIWIETFEDNNTEWIAKASTDAKVLGFKGGFSRKLQPVSKPVLPGDEGQVFISVRLTKTGLYRIRYADLKNAGIKVKQVDPRTFRLLNYGKQVPIYVSGESDGVFNRGDYIEFYGERNPNRVADYEYSPFTDENVYRLVWGKGSGLRYPVKSVGTILPTDEVIQPFDYDYTYHFEKNEYFERLGYVDTDQEYYVQDHWFFSQKLYGATSQDFSFNLPSPNLSTNRQFSVNLRLFGLYHGDNPHNVQIFINGISAGEGNWLGQTPVIIQNSPDKVLRNSDLQDGENELTFIVEGSDPGNEYDLIALDYMDITYRRLFKAYSDYIEFHRPAGSPDGIYQFRLTGFSSPNISLYSIGNYRLKDFEVIHEQDLNSYSLKFQDNLYSDDVYIAASASAILSPDTVFMDTLHYPQFHRNSADYIIIVADQFMNSLKPLLDYYQLQGIDVYPVRISDIFNAYSYGEKNPLSIRQFLADVYNNWIKVPEFVLLVGDADLPGGARNYIPTMFMQTYKFGAAASDYWYTLVDGDDLIPEFHIGRIPVGNEIELELFIKKLIAYNGNSPKSPWKKRHLFIAGFEDDFKEQTDYMIKNTLYNNSFIDRLLINPSSLATEYYGGTDSLIDKINRGLSFINFMGHGGGAVWGDRSLLTLDDVGKIDNGYKLPFIASMTCFTGDFAIYRSLGESLIKMRDGGAIGFWGSSGVGWIKNDFLLESHLCPVLFGGDLSVGEAITATKLFYLSDDLNSGYLKPSLVYQYNLMGDPAMYFVQPDTSLDLHISPQKISPGDSLSLNCDLPEGVEFYDLIIYDKNKYPLFKEINQPLISDNLSISVDIPADFPDGIGYVSLYFYAANGMKEGSVGGSFLSGMSTPSETWSTPGFPHFYDEIKIFADFKSQVDSLICEIDSSNVYEYLNDVGMREIVAFDYGDSGDIQIKMKEISSMRYETEAGFRIYSPGRKFAYRFRWLEKGEMKYSDKYVIRIRPLPDIYIKNAFQGGDKFPAVQTTLYCSGADTLPATLTAVCHELQDSVLFTRSCLLYPEKDNMISVPVLFTGDSVFYHLRIEPDGDVKESSKVNNTLYLKERRKVYLVTPGLGTTVEGNANDTIKVDSTLSILIPPGAVEDSCVFRIETPESLSTEQPDFRLLPWINGKCDGYGFYLSNDMKTLKPGIVFIENGDTGENQSPVCLYPGTNLWIKQEYESQEDNSFRLYIPAILAFAEIEDTQPPEITLSIDGQVYYENMYVSARPMISILMEDRNGVFINDERFELSLDGITIGPDNFSMPDSVNSLTHYEMTFMPELTAGERELSFKVQDAAGNRSEILAYFRVEERLRLIDYGNYPNPFSTRTWFVYELTQPVEKLLINIYSVSGRRIAILDQESVFTGDEINQAGYHEIPWDGRDDNLNFVANGVYFYKIVAKGARKTVYSKGTIAKVR